MAALNLASRLRCITPGSAGRVFRHFGSWGILRAIILLARSGKPQGEANLVRILRRLTVPASESQMAIALAMSVVMMSLLLYGIIWQSNVINYQRDLIRVIWPSH